MERKVRTMKTIIFSILAVLFIINTVISLMYLGEKIFSSEDPDILLKPHKVTLSTCNACEAKVKSLENHLKQLQDSIDSLDKAAERSRFNTKSLDNIHEKIDSLSTNQASASAKIAVLHSAIQDHEFKMISLAKKHQALVWQQDVLHDIPPESKKNYQNQTTYTQVKTLKWQLDEVKEKVQELFNKVELNTAKLKSQASVISAVTHDTVNITDIIEAQILQMQNSSLRLVGSSEMNSISTLANEIANIQRQLEHAGDNNNSGVTLGNTTLMQDVYKRVLTEMMSTGIINGTYKVVPDEPSDSMVNLKGNLTKLSQDLKQLEKKASLISTLPKTCKEYKKYGFPESGFFDIDPDGFGRGEGPIKVFCEFPSGQTHVLHDSEEATEIKSCKSPGCHNLTLSYGDVPMSQMVRLIELSTSCRQYIQFDCYLAPLTGYGQWIDRHGQNQSYFYGAHYGKTVCGCSANNTCTFSPRGHQCSCDVYLSEPKWQHDGGHINNKTALPITGFQYGFLGEKSKAKIRFGSLECEGEAARHHEHSCASLKFDGEDRSGYYIFPKDKDYLLYFCNMTLSELDPAIQTAIMPIAEKRPMVFFSMVRHEKFHMQPTQGNSKGSPIPFPDTEFSVGPAKLEAGTFIAPVAGKYAFLAFGTFYQDVSFKCTIQRRSSNQYVLEESHPFSFSQKRHRYDYDYDYEANKKTFSLSTFMTVEQNDEVSVSLKHGYLTDDPNRFVGIRINLE